MINRSDLSAAGTEDRALAAEGMLPTAPGLLRRIVYAVYMGTESNMVRLDDEAYDRLASLKREGESFSAVVRRVTGERSLTETGGIWREENGGVDDIREAINDRRERREGELDDIAEQIE